jgi:hypothetical protein
VLTFPGIFKMSVRTFLVAAPLTLGVFTIGTVLPTMVLIYAILVPRYLKLTGSSVMGASPVDLPTTGGPWSRTAIAMLSWWRSRPTNRTFCIGSALPHGALRRLPCSCQRNPRSLRVGWSNHSV